MTGPDEPNSGHPKDTHGTQFEDLGVNGNTAGHGALDNGGSEYEEQPVDLSLLQADDALLDALGGADPQVTGGLDDQELNAVLLAWRRDIDSEPVPDLVDHDYAVATLRTAKVTYKNGKKPRRRMLVPVAAAAAVLAITFGGVGLAARDAQPGDTLWGLTQVLYTDHAKSVQAASTVRTDLERASLALSNGNLDEARKALQAARVAMNEVSQEELRQLQAEHKKLRQKVDERRPGNNGGQGQHQSKPPQKPAPGDGSSSPDPSDMSTPPTQPTSPDDTSPSQPPDETGTSTPSPSSGNSNTGTSDGSAGEPTGGNNFNGSMLPGEN